MDAVPVETRVPANIYIYIYIYTYSLLLVSGHVSVCFVVYSGCDCLLPVPCVRLRSEKMRQA